MTQIDFIRSRPEIAGDIISDQNVKGYAVVNFEVANFSSLYSIH